MLTEGMFGITSERGVKEVLEATQGGSKPDIPDTPNTPKGVCFLHLFDTSERGVRGVKQGC